MPCEEFFRTDFISEKFEHTVLTVCQCYSISYCGAKQSDGALPASPTLPPFMGVLA